MGVVFAAGFVSLYVYDCCGNISESMSRFRAQYRELALILSYSLMFASTVFAYWCVQMAPNPLPHPHLGLYLFLVLALLLTNLFRRKSALYTLNCLLICNYLIVVRYLFPGYLPLPAVPVLMMAFDAEKREQETLKSKMVSGMFRGCACLVVFEMLRNPYFEMEMYVVGVAVLAGVLNR